LKLTITLPSIHGHALQRTLENIRDTTVGDHEVIVVSPNEPPFIGNITTFVKDVVLEGANAGHAQALHYARGDFIFPWVDDHLLVKGWDGVLLEEFLEREKEHQFFVMGARNAPHVGTVFGIYYPYFPLMRREWAVQTGWFDAAYRCGFADADLALRVWQTGGHCEWSNKWDDQRIIKGHLDDGRKGSAPNTTDLDTNLFLTRWYPIFGAGWQTADLRDYNRDVIPEPSRKSYSPDRRRLY
jgi:hypothetical protein